MFRASQRPHIPNTYRPDLRILPLKCQEAAFKALRTIQYNLGAHGQWQIISAEAKLELAGKADGAHMLDLVLSWLPSTLSRYKTLNTRPTTPKAPLLKSK